jgi:hypothetical protein
MARALMLASLLLAASQATGAPPLTDRGLRYVIDVRLDAATKTLEGTETIVYRNQTGRPLESFPFHLYLNAFRSGSSYERERMPRPGQHLPAPYQGGIDVVALQLEGGPDLTPGIEFVQPDDGNTLDRTVMQVRLPRPVAPGEAARFRLSFRARLPRILERTGYDGDFVMGAQWYPKLGVWWRGGWNAHQMHRSGEFFADFASYDVRLTLPTTFRVGATGEQQAVLANADGTSTFVLHADDVHDFAWAADPRFELVEDSWTGRAGPVRLRLLLQPRCRLAATYTNVLKAAFDRYSRWYGAYPYPQLTVVETPPASRAGGMEYPTLFTVHGHRWLLPGLRVPEVELAHEFGHQYWQGMVASHEGEEAWLDEGLNSYTTVKLMRSLFGPEESYAALLGVRADLGAVLRVEYRRLPDTDPLERPAWAYLSDEAYRTISYGKATSMLLTLEGVIGEATLRQAIRAYFERYRFRHPAARDFIGVVEETAGRNLGEFFEQAVYGTQVLDYSVEGLTADRLESTFRSAVLVHRKGDFIHPVDLVVRFADGHTARERWDGRERWARFAYDRASPVSAASVDPEGRIWLDRDLLNNGRTLAPDRRASRKLTAFWVVLAQLLAQLAAGFV